MNFLAQPPLRADAEALRSRSLSRKRPSRLFFDTIRR